MHTIEIAHLVLLASAIASPAAMAQTQNQIIGGGFSAFPWVWLTVAPGEVITISTTSLNVPDAVASQTPLPTTLSGVSVGARVIGARDSAGYPTALPILRVRTDGPYCSIPDSCSTTRIVVQIPTERVCAPIPIEPQTCPSHPPFPDLPPLLVLNIRANGVVGPDLPVEVIASSPHLLSSCDTIFGSQPIALCPPLITHPDGTLVSPASPARGGEIISVYAVGLGYAVANAPATGSAPAGPIQLPQSYGNTVFTYQGSSVPGPPPLGTFNQQQIVEPADWVGQIPGYVGLYQINVRVPPLPGPPPSCAATGGNATVTLTSASAGILSLCVQP